MRRFFRAAPLAVAVASVLVLQADHGAFGQDRADRLPGHRNLFNGDCNFWFGDAFMADPSAKYDPRTFAWYIDMLADCGVDTYVCNPCAQLPWYPSKRTPNILTGYRRGDRSFVRGHYPRDAKPERIDKPLERHIRVLDRTLDVVEADVNWVEEVSQACRRRGISPWLSIRMNDMHGGANWDDGYLNCPLQRDPRFRLDGRQINPRDGVNPMWQALDYAHPEVRDYMFTMIRELVDDYDYEGLELDWLRCPFCLDAPAAAEEVAKITKWHAQIRELTQARAKRLGKPYPLGLRIPCRLGQLKEIGIDVRAMVDAGLIDFVNVSNFFQTTWDVPYDEIRRELGDKVAIFGVVEAVPNWVEAYDPRSKKTSHRLLPSSPELLRGNAAGKLAMGVDGIETFNFFVADEPPHRSAADQRKARYPILKDLGDPATLAGRPKHYALASRGGLYDFPLYEYAEQIPVLVEAGAKQAFHLSMAAEPADAGLELVVQIVTDREEAPAELGVSFNGGTPHFDGRVTDRLLFPAGDFTHHTADHPARNFRFSAAAIRQGRNEVLVFNGNRSSAAGSTDRGGTLRVISVELAVSKPTPE